jgi:hypothetical protein
MFLAGFGTLWMIGWCRQMHGVDIPTLTVIVLAGSTNFLWALCEFRRGMSAHDMSVEPSIEISQRRAFRRVNLIQWLAIGVANIVLNAAGYVELIVPAVILIVGLHFIPLARAFRSRQHDWHRQHYVTGGALIAVALAYPWMAGGGPNYPKGEFATGSILWISAIYWGTARSFARVQNRRIACDAGQ